MFGILASERLRTALIGQGVCHGKPFRESWGEFLNQYDWTHWITVTFRSPRHPHNALSTLNQVRKVVRRTTKGGRLFLGVEPHKSRLIHLHGLVEIGDWADGGQASTHLWRNLFEIFGRSQVPAVRGNRGASFYVTKYVTKEFSEFIIE